jgi:hypothetical protein
LLAGVLLAPGAGAVITTACCGIGATRTVTLRVGTASAGAVDTVRFAVGSGSGNSMPTAPNPHGDGNPIAASTGAVPISVSLTIPGGNQPQPITTTVAAPATLPCVSAGCTGYAIPFSSISWTATSPGGGDFSNGTFGTTTTIQQDTFNGFYIFIFPVGGSYTVSSNLTFSYANVTAYPAGVYRNTVTYTVTLP